MLKILIKHYIYEICLEIIFSTVHTNFQKPITEREQVIGKIISNILFAAKQIEGKTVRGNAHFVVSKPSITNYLTNSITNQIDKKIISSMIKSMGK